MKPLIFVISVSAPSDRTPSAVQHLNGVRLRTLCCWPPSRSFALPGWSYHRRAAISYFCLRGRLLHRGLLVTMHYWVLTVRSRKTWLASGQNVGVASLEGADWFCLGLFTPSVVPSQLVESTCGFCQTRYLLCLFPGQRRWVCNLVHVSYISLLESIE